MSANDAPARVHRLEEMLLVNTKNLLGENAAKKTLALSQPARSAATKHCPTYGDGRLQPHEFIRDRCGALFKSDWHGHDVDHTIVGQQSWLWDVAGLLVEWQPEQHVRKQILDRLKARHQFDGEVLRFYCAAYAAFRAGMMTFGEAASASEQHGVRGAMEYYSSALKYCLDASFPRPRQRVRAAAFARP